MARLSLKVAVASAILAILSGIWYTIAALHFYEQALSNAEVTRSVSIGNRIIEVKNGVAYEKDTRVGPVMALRSILLAYDVTLAERSPIFGLEGTDPDALKSNVRRLADVQEKYAALQAKESEAEAIRSGLYPIRFLDSLAELEKARLAFIKAPASGPDALYDQAVQGTVRTYMNDLKAFRDSFIRFVPSDFPDYAVFDGYVSRAKTIRMIDEMQNQANLLADRLKRREYCAKGLFMYCDTKELDFPMPDTPAPPKSSPDHSAEAIALFRDIKKGNPRFLVSIFHSECVASEPELHRFALWDQSTNDPPVFVGDTFFYPIESMSASTSNRALMGAAGVQYLYMSPTVFYQCPDSGDDWGRIYSAIAAYASLHPEDPQGSLDESRVIQEVRDKLRDPTLRDAMVPVALMMKDRSAGFDAFVGFMATIGVSNIHIHSENPAVKTGPAFLFAVESAFQALFLTWNTSVFSEYRSIATFDEGRRAKNTLVRWSELSDQWRAQAKKDLTWFVDLHATPNK